MKSCIASHQRSESCASVITSGRRRILGQICSIGSVKIVRLNQQLIRPYRGVMKVLGLSRHAANKRLERTRHQRASLLSNLGEPLKRNVRCYCEMSVKRKISSDDSTWIYKL